MSVETPPPPAKPSAINPKLIVPFVQSVKTVFKTMVNVEATIERRAATKSVRNARLRDICPGATSPLSIRWKASFIPANEF